MQGRQEDGGRAVGSTDLGGRREYMRWRVVEEDGRTEESWREEDVESL
jgi:hypothetical protein